MNKPKEHHDAHCLCCGSFAVSIQPTEKGVVICVQTDDAAKAEALRRVSVCCAPAQGKATCCDSERGETGTGE